MVDYNLYNEILTDLTVKGAMHADIFISSGDMHSLVFDNGKIEGASSATSCGTSVRIIKNNQSFISHAPGTTSKNLTSLLCDCADNANIRFSMNIDVSGNSNVLNREEAIHQLSADFFHDLDNTLRSESKHIRQCSFRYLVTQKDVIIITPSKIVRYRRNFSSFTTQVVIEKNGVLQQGSERRYLSVPINEFWKDTTPTEIALTALRRANLMLTAQPCPAGVMNVLLDGEAGGTIIHEACGHGLEADIVEKEKSVYQGRIGKQVASECVTIIDDPQLQNNLYGSYNFDDEGTPAQRTILIENGILKTYMTDILSSKQYNLPLTGNGRRESYRHLPIPRMSNTYLVKGKDSFEDMLAQADNGLYVKKMGGGEVDPTSGDFVFYVSEGYLLKNGKICEPVKGAIMTGNGPDVLCNVKSLGHNLIMDAGICGKSGQNVPVTDGQPTMLIHGITVGGTKA